MNNPYRTYPGIPFPGVDCCPRCSSIHIRTRRRGYSWFWGILGFFIFPGFGLLLGFIGRNNLRSKCMVCRRRWTRKP